MSETVTRADRLAALLSERPVDVLLVTDPVNVRYLTGFTGSSGAALVGEGTRTFITDFRYREQAAVQVADFDRRECSAELLDGVAGALGDERPVRLGFDDAHTTVAAHARLRERLDDGVELVACGGLVERLRAVKSDDERDRIAAAATLADDALASVLERGLIGRTERAVAIELEHEMLLRGARQASFPSIVASAEHGALPHAEPRDVEIGVDVLVTIDWGAELDGYCSDCTRTVATGDSIGEQERDIYALVLEAQHAGLDAVVAGAGGRAIDAVARELIAARGHGEHFGHGLGHGVGLEVHERPRLSRLSDDELERGNVVTVEPGIYLPGRCGVRIEDLVVVTDAGREVLTSLSKELTIVS